MPHIFSLPTSRAHGQQQFPGRPNLLKQRPWARDEPIIRRRFCPVFDYVDIFMNCLCEQFIVVQNSEIRPYRMMRLKREMPISPRTRWKIAYSGKSSGLAQTLVFIGVSGVSKDFWTLARFQIASVYAAMSMGSGHPEVTIIRL
ncbi:hypothetical protein [Occallatibacter savannae]|uniref:hypothetical protein n=1 Tax=Occallatibacter savannae TaxID=1002691 RepID=UPI0013A5874C|nr:hypothetical protein [Occallatibacter savannae]